MLDLGITIITPYDEEYPELLRQTAQHPWVLYTIGKVELLNQPCVAIVGTRGPTAYGRRTASDLGEQLSASGLTVVSGLARGIDGAAHEGALRASGSTIAVLGTPVDTIYPKEHRALYNDIAEAWTNRIGISAGNTLPSGAVPSAQSNYCRVIPRHCRC